MSGFDGAVVREQGITFGIAVVRSSALNDRTNRDQTVAEFSAAFGGIPTVLMAQDGRGRGIPSYYGRRDIVDFLTSVPVDAIPWRRYSLREAA